MAATVTPLVSAGARRGRSRTRLAAAVALLAAAVVGGLGLLFAGSSGGDGALAWKGNVQVFQSERPTDQVLYAQLENTSLRDVSLDVTRVRALDASGHEVQSAATFLAAFAHGIWGASQKADITDFEKRRLGKIATLKPGQVVPLTLSWRVPEGGARPVKVRLGNDLELAVPKGPAVTP